jgi:DNA polymerase-3 subunit epsilon
MRRRYPGHQSYSLGNLCETYGIDLKDHHRALCDARAAAQLLNLINQEREGGPNPATSPRKHGQLLHAPAAGRSARAPT